MDWTKDMKAIICDSCGNPFKIETKCHCHECGKRREHLLVARYVTTAIVAAFMSMLGGCWVYNKYNSDTVKAALQYYEIQKVDPSYKRADGTTDTNPVKLIEQEYEVVPKPKKKE